MNPSEADDRCLPGVSKWTKRSDRQDFIDICASPPSDGFFYANQHSRMNRQQQTAIGGCVQVQEESGKDNSMGNIIPKFGGETPAGDDQAVCFNNESSGFFKSYGPAYPATNGGGDASAGGVGSLLTGKVLNMSSADLEKWAKKNVTAKSGSAVLEAADYQQHPTDDSAPSAVDHLVARVPMITKTEEGGSTRLIERFGAQGTPDVTPSTTPAVTPACSPQVPRRPGNPFFSGNSNRKEEGNWLFRSATQEDSNNVLYEAKMSIETQFPQAEGKKSVRYVPRPSQLRELNFWSPTSM